MLLLLQEMSLFEFIIVLCVTAWVYFGYGILYRLYLGPLAKIPGSKLAALTGWYETYFDCFKQGRYWTVVEKMHERYGNTPFLSIIIKS